MEANGVEPPMAGGSQARSARASVVQAEQKQSQCGRHYFRSQAVMGLGFERKSDYCYCLPTIDVPREYRQNSFEQNTKGFEVFRVFLFWRSAPNIGAQWDPHRTIIHRPRISKNKTGATTSQLLVFAKNPRPRIFALEVSESMMQTWQEIVPREFR